MDSTGVVGDSAVHNHSMLEKCSQNVFRSVTEISSSGGRSSLAAVDMVCIAHRPALNNQLIKSF